jgi:cell wall-associated NlpC family hydrolase
MILIAVAALISGGMASWSGVGYEVYYVQSADSVERIASRFGVEAQAVRDWNRLSPDAQPSPGQSLVVPLPGAERATPAGPRAAAEQVRASKVIGNLGVVTAATAKIQRNPGSGRILFRCPKGTQLVIASERAGYYGVLMADGSTGWLSQDQARKDSVQLTSTPSDTGSAYSGGRSDVVREAFRYWGTPYQLGGRLPGSVDCSLLVQTAFRTVGVSLPRTAASQFMVGTPVPYNQLAPGDRLYFVNSSGRIGHTGLYIGGGQFIHASSNRGCVAVDNLTSDTYWRKFAGARR